VENKTRIPRRRENRTFCNRNHPIILEVQLHKSKWFTVKNSRPKGLLRIQENLLLPSKTDKFISTIIQIITPKLREPSTVSTYKRNQ